MKDPHQNLFYYYGKHYNILNKNKKNERRIYDPQLENNTTKAFINLFEIGDKKHTLLKLFLKKILKPYKKIKFDNVKFNLQVQTESRKSVPDASIIIDSKLYLYFENKITKTKEGSKSLKKQLLRHWKETKGKNKFLFLLTKDYEEPPFVAKLRKKGINIKFLNWMDIFSIIEECRDKIDNIFIQQFLNYLKVISMAPFRGFEKEDFDIFLLEDVESFRENIIPLKEKVGIFLKNVKGNKHLDSKVKNKLKFIKVGNVRDESNSLWASMSIGQYHQDLTHYSFLIRPDITMIFVTSQNTGLIRSFLKNINSKGEFDKLLRILKKMGSFKLILKEIIREGVYHRAKKYIPVLELNCRYIDRLSLNALLEKMKKLKYCEITLCKDFQKVDIIDTGTKFIEDVSKAMNQMYDYYKYMDI